MKKIAIIIIAAAAQLVSASALEKAGCMNGYYKQKHEKCVQYVLDVIDEVPRDELPLSVYGFLGGLWLQDNAFDVVLQKKITSKPQQIFYSKLLYLMDERQKAVAYARQYNVHTEYKEVVDGGLPPLKQLKPQAFPGGNDMLIGAFFATGDDYYIENIFTSFEGQKEADIASALRYAYLNASFVPQGYPADKVQDDLCKRYACKKDDTRYLHVLTMASALWALESLSEAHPIIKNKMKNFYQANPHIMKLQASERALAIYFERAVDNDPSISKQKFMRYIRFKSVKL